MTNIKKPNGDAFTNSHLSNGAASHLAPNTVVIALPCDDGIDETSRDRFLESSDGDTSRDDSGDFAGLKKDEVAKYINDPYWVRLRVVLLMIFGAAFVAMFVAAIVIIVLAPRCPPRPHQEWWEKAVIYHIHPLSFQDSNADGFGDLNGIHSRLDYLRDVLKVDAVSLGPIFPSGFEVDGYDVTNPTVPCPGHYGTEENFNSLRAALHKAGMKLILDFIPNHTSKKHGWFKNSANMTGGNPTYRDFYIWHNGTTAEDGSRQPPNNWKNVSGSSAWTWHTEREQFYYHTYSEHEPDLNLRNEKVKLQLKAILRIWLDRKVDGFVVRDAQYLFEPVNLTTEASLIQFQPESSQLVAEWREFLDNYTNNESKSRSGKVSRLLIADVGGTSEQSVKFYQYSDGDVTKPGAHLSTNKALVSITQSCTSQCVLELVSGWINAAANVTANWMVGTIDSSRLATRLNGSERLNAVHLLMMTLGGASMTLYGDELGMGDGLDYHSVGGANFLLPTKRPQLSPMQWNTADNAGFTSPRVTPWMPLANNFHLTSLQTQQAHGSGVNHFKAFTRLIELRRSSESLQWGALKGVVEQGGVLMYMREAEGFNPLLVAINFGPGSSTVDLHLYLRTHMEDRQLPKQMTIVTSTFNFRGSQRANAYTNGTKIDNTKMIYLEPTEGVVLSWSPKDEIY